jgi:uncharacterized glyoxalase superfamily protein PhnB
MRMEDDQGAVNHAEVRLGEDTVMLGDPGEDGHFWSFATPLAGS